MEAVGGVKVVGGVAGGGVIGGTARVGCSESGRGSPALVGNAKEAPRQARPQAQREGAPRHRRCEAGRAAVAGVEPGEAARARDQLGDAVAEVAALFGEGFRRRRRARGRHEKSAARDQRRLRCVGQMASWVHGADGKLAAWGDSQPPARGILAASTQGWSQRAGHLAREAAASNRRGAAAVAARLDAGGHRDVAARPGVQAIAVDRGVGPRRGE